MNFGSDNQTGASAQVMAALAACNEGHEHSYGGDRWTARAVAALRDTFGCDLAAYFVPTGTAANCLALACLAKPWQTILCHDQSHVLLDELTAPEFFSGGARPIGISRSAGKLEPHHLAEYFARAGGDAPHNAAASALTVTQSSENGLVYAPAEIAALAEAARRHGLRLHVDGARFANAVAALGCQPADISWRAGVDVMSLGATKNGALGAEAVIFFDRTLAAAFEWRRKRAGHLVSKSRFIAAQFVGWLDSGHWLQLAQHANAAARRLAAGLAAVPGVRVVWPAQANEVFAAMPRTVSQALQDAGAEFHEWPASGLPPGTALAAGEVYVRLVASFLTEDRDVDALCAIAAAASAPMRPA